MLITFDSNASWLVRDVVQRCKARVFRWCVADCECIASPPFNSQCDVKLLYDTPIALCENVNMPKDIDIHFMYIDERQDNASLRRIRGNLKTLRSRYVVIGNGEAECTGCMYVLQRSMNMPNAAIAKALARIVNAYIETRTLQHPNDIASRRYGSTSLGRAMNVDVLGIAKNNDDEGVDVDYGIDCVSYSC